MNKISFYILFIIYSIPTLAKPIDVANRVNVDTIIVYGKVMDSLYNEPIFGATILLKSGLNRIMTNAVSSKDGDYLIEENINDALDLDSVYILITSIGYKEKILKIRNFKNGITTYLSPKYTQLKEVVIKGDKQLIRIEDDKLVYNASKDETNKGISAVEVLQKAPLIFIDNSNIYLRGNKNYKILLNGKETGYLQNNPFEVLRSMPADMIKDVEIVTNPTAKYSGEDIGGVINIITNKKLADSYFGSLGLGVTSRGGYNSLGFFSTKIGKLGINANLNYLDIKEVRSFNSNDIINNTEPISIKQKENLRNVSNASTSFLDASYEIDTFTLANFSLYYYNVNVKTDQNLFSQELDNTTPLTYLRNIKRNTSSGFVNFGIDLQRTFKNPVKSLTFSARSEIISNDIKYDALQYEPEDLYSFSERAVNDGTTQGSTIQVDYVQPYRKKQKLEIGIKTIFRKSFTNDDYYLKFDETSDYTNSPLLYNSLKYRQNVQAIYTSYSLSRAKLFSNIGGRIESTQISSTNFKPTYLNILPNISFGININDKSSISAVYNKTVLRPSLNFINPFVNRINPRQVLIGNPNLRPETVNKLSLNLNAYISKSFSSSSLYYKFSNNSIQSFYYIQDSVLVNSYNNNSKFSEVGFNFYNSFTIQKRLNLRLNLDLSYFRVSNVANTSLNKENINYKVFLSSAYYLPKDFSLSFNGYFYSAKVNYQGRTIGFYDTSISLNKKLFNKKGNLAVSLNQPFQSKIIQKGLYKDNGFTQNSTVELRDQFVKLDFRYTFGNLKQYFKRRTREIQNNDLKE